MLFGYINYIVAGCCKKNFQPDEQYRILRTYVRQRKNLISISSDSVRRMQKALELMNIKLHTVISDILGKTGMQILEAILSGERDPEALAALTDPRIKASRKISSSPWKGYGNPNTCSCSNKPVRNTPFTSNK